MAELYIFSQDDELLTIISEDDGLVSAVFREELNGIADDPFTFRLEAESPKSAYVFTENQVVFRDKEGDLRLFTIKRTYESYVNDIPTVDAECEPAVMELAENIIEERRMREDTAQVAIDRALAGTRWTGIIEVDLGLATESFYYISSIDAIFLILETWGGEFKDVVRFNDKNEIIAREVRITQRRGSDNGKRFEVGYNAENIEREVVSYPVTALYGRGSSIEVEDEDGEHTGGYTRLIDFGNVEWKRSSGDPVDKPLGQKWVGDPDALLRYGRKENGTLLHREGIMEDHNIEDPEILLRATWEHLKVAQHPEVFYALYAYLLEYLAGYEHEKVSLGDTAIANDRNFSNPIEVQTRVIAIEYDILNIEDTAKVEMGQFLGIHNDRLDELERNIGDLIRRPPRQRIDIDSYPNRIPPRPVNLRAEGGFSVIQLYWDFSDVIWLKHYEVYGSQVADFVPASQHLLWRGDVSGFAHKVNTDETWYYYVRAVNYHGTASEWSIRVSASTVRIISDDILFGEEIAEELRRLSETSKILADNSITGDLLGEDVTTEINTARNRADEAHANANLATQNATDAINQAQTSFDKAQEALTESATAILNSENALSESGTARSIADTASGLASDAYNRATSAGNNASQALQDAQSALDNFEGLRSEFDNLEIGGRNLFIRSTAENGYIDTSGMLRQSGSVQPVVSDYIEILYEDYTASLYPTEDDYLFCVAYYDADKVFISRDVTSNQVTVTFKPIDNAVYMRVWARYLEGGEMQLEKGNRATDWQPAPEDIFSEIDKKADGSTVYTIEQIDGIIDNTVSIDRYTTDIDGILSNIESHSTKISQNETAIGLRATTDDLDAVNQTLTNRIGEIEVEAEKVGISVGQIRTEFDNLEIGGRNLIPDSNDFRNFRRAGVSTSFETVEVPEWNVDNATKIVASGGSGNKLTSNIYGTTGIVGVYSLYVKNVGSNDLLIHSNGWQDRDTGFKFEVIVKPDESKRIVLVGRARTAYDFIQFHFSETTSNDTLEVILWGEQLEKGDKVTDWQPAPEDTDSRINSITQNLTELTVDLNGITQSVSNIESTTDNLTSRIAEVETTADGITQTVSKVRADLDGLEYENRNLAIGTATDGFSSYTRSNVSIIESEPTYIIRTECTENGIFGFHQQTLYRKMRLEEGEEYTLSFEVRGNVDLLNYVYIMHTQTGNQSLFPARPVLSETEFTKVIFPFTKIYDSETSYVMISTTNGVIGDWFEVKNIKVEKGSKATSWQPAVEDLATQVQFSQITQTVDNISSEVAKKVDDTVYSTFVEQTERSLLSKISEQDADSRYASQSSLEQEVGSITGTISNVRNSIDGLPIVGKNYYDINNTVGLGIPSFSTPTGIFDAGDDYKSFYMPVEAGEVYSVSRRDKENYVFAVAFTENEPAQSDPYFGMVNGNNELKIEGIEVPSNANWMLVYVSYLGVDVEGVKIEKGDKATMSPENIEYEIATLRLTSDAFAVRIENSEGDISRLTQTAEGFQGAVDNVEGELSTVSLLANTLRTELQTAEGNISTLTQTAQSLDSRISDVVYNKNILPGMEVGHIDWSTGENSDSYSNRLRSPLIEVEPEITYTFSIRGNEESVYWFEYGFNGQFLEYTYSRTHTVSMDTRYVRLLKTLESDPNQQFQVEAGSSATDYIKHFGSVSQSQITQLANNINLRVEIGDVINQINLDTSGALIAGENIILDGNVTVTDLFKVGEAHITNAAIGTAHIQNGAITNAKIDRLAVSTAQIQDGAITNAKIGNLAVDTANIATGAITNAKIANLSVDKLYGSLATFTRTNFNNISQQVQITGLGLETYSGSSMTSRLDGNGHSFYRNGNHIGNIGTSTWVGRPTYRGLTFQMTDATNYMAWSYQENPGENFITRLAWHKNAVVADRRGFSFSDHVTLNSDDNLYVRTLSTTGFTDGTRFLTLRNETFAGNLGVSIRRSESGGRVFLTTSRALLMSSGNAYLEVAQDSNGNFIQSIDIFNRSTTSTNNMLQIATNGNLRRSTSSRRYKLLEKSIELDYAKKLLTLDTKSWYDKKAVESYSQYLAEGGSEGEKDDIRRIPGIIAEDVHDAGLDMYVNYDELGRPDGVSINLPYLMLPLVKDLYNQVDELKSENATISEQYEQATFKIAQLEARLNILEVSA